jgi:hypothetical protein
VTENNERLELLRIIERLAREAARGEEELVKVRQELSDTRNANIYWTGEYGKGQARIKELEARVHELSSPLAELARASKE